MALRPHEEDPDGLAAAIEELGVGPLLLRLHPWQSEYRAEEELAERLAGAGHELTFALPQNRELVRFWWLQLPQINSVSFGAVPGYADDNRV